MAIDIEAWYRAHGPMVLRRCRQLLKDEQLAQDAMHEVFVRLVRVGDRLDDRAPTGLLYRMATQQCLNVLRSKRRHPEDKVDELLMNIAGHGRMSEDLGARSVLARLFSRTQESTEVMAVLHYVDGLTLQEVADEVGMSVSGVRKRLRQLRSNLHDMEAA